MIKRIWIRLINILMDYGIICMSCGKFGWFVKLGFCSKECCVLFNALNCDDDCPFKDCKHNAPYGVDKNDKTN